MRQQKTQIVLFVPRSSKHKTRITGLIDYKI